jgi:hypothetical protein
LLWVHTLRFARRYAEERRIEAVHARQEAAAARRDRAYVLGVGVIERLDVPAIAGQGADRVDLAGQQPPEARRVVDAAGDAAAEADDRDRLARAAARRAAARASPRAR